MPRITVKETITKEIEIPIEAVYQLIDNPTREDILQYLRKHGFGGSLSSFAQHRAIVTQASPDLLVRNRQEISGSFHLPMQVFMV